MDSRALYRGVYNRYSSLRIASHIAYLTHELRFSFEWTPRAMYNDLHAPHVKFDVRTGAHTEEYLYIRVPKLFTGPLCVHTATVYKYASLSSTLTPDSTLQRPRSVRAKYRK